MKKTLTTEDVGVIALVDEKGELAGVVHKDPKTRKNVFYKCEEMSFDEIKQMFPGQAAQQ